jgi:hypothetical protein
MAEAIAALGIACSVFQVISFAHEVYNVSKEIKETGSSNSSTLVRYQVLFCTTNS